MASIATPGRPRNPDTSTLPWLDVFDLLPMPVWLIGKDADLWFGNRAWRQLTSADREPARTGTGWLAALHEKDRSRTMAAFRHAAAARSRVEIAVRVRSADGYRSWALTGVPYGEPGTSVQMFVGAASDLTAVRDTQRRLRDVGGRLVAAQEAERARIGRELHDDIAQRIALLSVKLDAASQSRPFSATRVRRLLREADDVLRELSRAIHTLSYELHPPNLRLLGLVPTLRALCAEMTTSRLTVRFTAGDIPRVTGDVALCIYRVAQEALHNALKHSGAQHIAVRLQRGPSAILLWIADDGAGFDPAARPDLGLGLSTMRERIELAGGRLRIISESGCGTIVEALVPTQPSTTTP